MESGLETVQQRIGEPVAVLRRRIGASLERVWENVLDWEHLPWLHEGAFAAVECLAAGEWGWRARAALTGPGERSATYALEVDRDRRRYVARTEEGLGAGSEIWTTLAPHAARSTDIVVSFHVPGVAQDRRAAIGASYLRLYQKLWDEDEQMMIEREARLSAARAPQSGVVSLGSLETLRGRVPLTVEVAGGPYRVVDVAGALVVHTAVCPHRLGPLVDAVDGAPEQVRCPWHGYRFDVRTGRSCDGRSLRLVTPARLEVDAAGEVTLRAGPGVGAD